MQIFWRYNRRFDISIENGLKFYSRKCFEMSRINPKFNIGEKLKQCTLCRLIILAKSLGTESVSPEKKCLILGRSKSTVRPLQGKMGYIFFTICVGLVCFYIGRVEFLAEKLQGIFLRLFSTGGVNHPKSLHY